MVLRLVVLDLFGRAERYGLTFQVVMHILKVLQTTSLRGDASLRWLSLRYLTAHGIHWTRSLRMHGCAARCRSQGALVAFLCCGSVLGISLLSFATATSLRALTSAGISIPKHALRYRTSVLGMSPRSGSFAPCIYALATISSRPFLLTAPWLVLGCPLLTIICRLQGPGGRALICAREDTRAQVVVRLVRFFCGGEYGTITLK